MPDEIRPIREWEDVTRERFENEIAPLRQPAVFRGLLHNWPIVAKGRSSSAEAAEYLKRLYSRKQIGTIRAPASERGRLFYNREINGYNFQRTMQDLRLVLQELLDLEPRPDAPTVAMQAVTAADHLPGFEDDNPMPLVPAVGARLWIGNAAMIAPHYDLLENLACVAVGRRRFTVFPPEQLENLYVGPIDNTPAGAPISMVDLNAPDFDRYPRFAEALAHAQTAELEAGDVIFIPYMWWHGVQALERFNILVNYWWDEHARPELLPPRVAMMIARLAFSDMSPEQRGRWRAMFDHYIFNDDDNAMEHLPEHARGIFGKLDSKQVRQLRQVLSRMLVE
jgi:hypothetical protein